MDFLGGASIKYYCRDMISHGLKQRAKPLDG